MVQPAAQQCQVFCGVGVGGAWRGLGHLAWMVELEC
jgi:hypothetical protein